MLSSHRWFPPFCLLLHKFFSFPLHIQLCDLPSLPLVDPHFSPSSIRLPAEYTFLLYLFCSFVVCVTIVTLLLSFSRRAYRSFLCYPHLFMSRATSCLHILTVACSCTTFPVFNIIKFSNSQYPIWVTWPTLGIPIF